MMIESSLCEIHNHSDCKHNISLICNKHIMMIMIMVHRLQDSFNGTKINGRNLKVDKEYFIKHGTVLSFGDDFLARYQMFEKDDEWDFEGSDEEEIAAQDEIENAVILQQMSDAASGSAEGTPPPPTAEQEVGSVAAEAQTANEKDCSCCD